MIADPLSVLARVSISLGMQMGRLVKPGDVAESATV
jgi:hypothetical protein